MRPLTAEERWAIQVLASGSHNFDVVQPDGARLDAAMYQLIERGCVAWKRWADNRGTSFWLTELGEIASRLPTIP